MDVYDRGLLRLVLHPRRTQDRTLFASTLRFFVPYFPRHFLMCDMNGKLNCGCRNSALCAKFNTASNIIFRII